VGLSNQSHQGSTALQRQFTRAAFGDPTKPIADDPAKQCFGCHGPQKANDYVFSTYLQ
jgi:hypothetical protein